MSISARAKHVMSAMLVVVVASSGSAWASIDRTTHCMKQMNDCSTTALITCCVPTAPIPIDRATLPMFAPSPSHVSTASLMDHFTIDAPSAPALSVPSPHWLRVLDLPILHRSFVI
jgi:hypothetical protein